MRLPELSIPSLSGWLDASTRKALFEDYSKTFSVGNPDEVAEACGYLVRCNYDTGQTVTADGGSVIV